jgi:hypothetical protein
VGGIEILRWEQDVGAAAAEEDGRCRRIERIDDRVPSLAEHLFLLLPEWRRIGLAEVFTS